jgi:hypothetical protein
MVKKIRNWVVKKLTSWSTLGSTVPSFVNSMTWLLSLL